MVVGFEKVLCLVGKIIFNIWSLWLVKELVLVSVVGQGTCVSFWKDKWCEDTSLMVLFPTLFICSSNREATIAEVLSGRWRICYLGGIMVW